MIVGEDHLPALERTMHYSLLDSLGRGLLALSALAFSAGGAHSDETSAEPRQPGGLLTNQLGTCLSIEGVPTTDGKDDASSLMVDTVVGKKLPLPIPILVRRAFVADDNLKIASLDLPARERCIFKGFATGEMIGVAPAAQVIARERGWKVVPMSSASWQWRPYFAALVVAAPRELPRTE
jgi:hypothetical protein